MWNPVEGTSGDGYDGGVCGTEGGFVGFVTGRVQWFEHFLWKRYLHEDEDTSNIWETLNPDAVVVDWKGKVSAGNTPPPTPPPSEPEVPGESEDPEEPPEGSGETEGSEEEPSTPDEPDEPEPTPEEPEPEPDAVQDMIDFFKGDGIWGNAQKDILYAMDDIEDSQNVPGAIYRFFDAYYSKAFLTTQELAQAVSNSFAPAYGRIYEKLGGQLVYGSADDINAALGYGGWDANNIHIQEAKNLAAAYKATVDQSIAPYLEDTTYNTYLELLTTELVNPKEGHNYRQDERIVNMDHNDPKVALAFAHVAIEMLNYMLAEL